MRKIKKLAIVSVCIIGVGVVLAIAGFSMGGEFGIVKDRSGYKIFDNEDKIIINEELPGFKSIEINSNIDNIDIIKSDIYGIEMQYGEGEGEVNYAVEDGKLIIKQFKPHMVGIGIGYVYVSSYAKVYVPSDIDLDTIDIKANNSNFTMNNINVSESFIDCSYGDLNISDLKGNKIDISGANNDILMNNIVTNELIASSNYGDLKAENINSNIFKIDINNGDVTLNNIKCINSTVLKNLYGSISIKDSEFNTLTNDMSNGNLYIENTNLGNASSSNKYGNIEFNNTISKGLQVKASNSHINLVGEFKGATSINLLYGDVKLKTNMEQQLYNYNVSCEYGDVRIGGQKFEKNVQENENNSENNINITSSNGDITLDFNEK